MRTISSKAAKRLLSLVLVLALGLIPGSPFAPMKAVSASDKMQETAS